MNNDLLKLPAEIYLASENKKLILFLGAGLSSAAKIDDWTTLKNRMIDKSPLTEENKIGLRKERDYYKCFQWIKNEQPAFYSEMLDSALRSKQEELPKFIRLFQSLISLNPASIITTNVDDLIVDSSVDSEMIKKFQFRYLDECAAQDLGQKIIFFLHGNRVENIFSSNDFREFHSNPTVVQFLTTLFQTYFVLFIGYSFSEEMIMGHLDLHRQHQNQQRMRHVALIPSIHESPTRQVLWDLHGIKTLEYLVQGEDHSVFDQTIYSWEKLKVRPQYEMTEASGKAANQ